MNQPIITLQGISKSFFDVHALDNINVSFFPGDIHAVVGENGAGKSTLMKILAGDYVRDAGKILFNGELESLGSPKRAQQIGIGMIYQELTLLPIGALPRIYYLAGSQKTGWVWSTERP